jgi:hypothetical protein
MSKQKILIVMFVAVLLAACAGGEVGAPQIAPRDAWVRSANMMPPEENKMGGTPPAGQMHSSGNSAAYMILQNSGDTADRLVQAKSEVAQAVELHLSEMKGEVMTMRPVEFIEVPGKGQVALKPGGLHIMLIGLKQNLVPGDKVKLTLVFEKSGEMLVEAEVRMP